MRSIERNTDALATILSAQPVIPVLKIHRLADAVPIARALHRGGLRAIEITLRTPEALDAIRLVVDEAPEVIVGAGTILDPRQYNEAQRAGARFIVSPGTTLELLDEARLGEVPLLPGAATPSEIMAMREEGYSLLKFFPAEQSGGAAFLKALASPFPDVRFCPTGGITPQNAATYLTLPNVIAVGGSWLVPDDRAAAGDWAAVERLAAEASALR